MNSTEWMELVKQRKEWVDLNFPPDVPSHSILGVIEEVGELTHHYLKMTQGIRGTDDEHLSEIRDAIADTAIYLMGVMYHEGCYFWGKPIVVLGSTEDKIMRLANATGDLAMGRGTAMDRIGMIIFLLEEIADDYMTDFDTLVRDTWEKVSKRNWVDNPQDGVNA